MLRPILTLAAVGFAGVLALKLIWLLLLPLVGALIGFAVLAIKIALIVALVLIALKLFRKVTRPLTVES